MRSLLKKSAALENSTGGDRAIYAPARRVTRFNRQYPDVDWICGAWLSITYSSSFAILMRMRRTKSGTSHSSYLTSSSVVAKGEVAMALWPSKVDTFAYQFGVQAAVSNTDSLAIAETGTLPLMITFRSFRRAIKRHVFMRTSCRERGSRCKSILSRRHGKIGMRRMPSVYHPVYHPAIFFDSTSHHLIPAHMDRTSAMVQAFRVLLPFYSTSYRFSVAHVATRSGRRGRGFESRQPDHLKIRGRMTIL